MIFQSGKYCDILIAECDQYYKVRIRDTGDTHLDIACTDLPHALRLWTDIERSPEVKIVVDVSDYIVKDKPTIEPIRLESGQLNPEFLKVLQADAYPPLDCMAANSNHDNGSEFADCRHRPIAKEDCDLREFDLEEMA